ncbi:unnamed protein product [Caenorhabditis auriculariae]|uniref:Uncharacterized protein n=1 Tax=Caenorhabditis auriculariae TaxID=2777116 RepID=A0A8S1GQD2_9PELO|nr:unnamed protein product [Caenorhabditis auriculariae]
MSPLDMWSSSPRPYRKRLCRRPHTVYDSRALLCATDPPSKQKIDRDFGKKKKKGRREGRGQPPQQRQTHTCQTAIYLSTSSNYLLVSHSSLLLLLDYRNPNPIAYAFIPCCLQTRQ